MKPGQIVYQDSEIVIRSSQPGDEKIMANYINAISKEKTFIRFQGESISLEEEKKYLEGQLKRIEKNESVHLLAFSQETLIGIAGLDMKDKIASHVGVFGISVAKGFRGKGIGKLLMETVLKEAEKNIPQLKIVSLGVFSNNTRAIALYRKLGFKKHGSLPKGVFYKGKYFNHNYMYKVIKDNSLSS